MSWIGALGIMLMIAGSGSASAQISLIVSKESRVSPTSSELKDIFNGLKLQWSDGTRIVVVEQGGTKVGKAFCESFLGKSVSQFRNAWTKLVLGGQANAPLKQTDDASVLRQVAQNPSAIGFVATASLDESVTEVYRVIAFMN